ncbi:hypothetical protein NPIL_611151 [Nephila pilipes]|uniref:Uncharacterized protein n=1 Tax=Nephila pilipes TaxID=299642 RepID=A0A8X6QU13_NEPPI|nr:hypothetical protein NPIL_611151 [Nephila pilipes]
MEMLNDSQNEMEFKDDSRSPISTSSIDTSSTCERKQKIESNIQVYTSVRQVTKRELAQNFSIHNDYEHPEYKSLKNSIRWRCIFLEDAASAYFVEIEIMINKIRETRRIDRWRLFTTHSDSKAKQPNSTLLKDFLNSYATHKLELNHDNELQRTTAHGT